MKTFFSHNKNKQQLFSAKSNDFPELNNGTKKNNSNSKMNYKDKLQTINSVNSDVTNELKEGMISLYYDKNTGKLCIETSKQNISIKKNKPSNISFNLLVKQWDKWYDNYIELYDENIYTHFYLFPYYNYNYFDELDEIFYKKLEELEELEKMDEIEE